MKTLLLTLLTTLNLFAGTQNFKPILDYYKTHIGEDEEAFLELRVHKAEKSELNQIIGSTIEKPHYHGLQSIEINSLRELETEEDESIDILLEKLFDNNDTYFCDTVKGQNPDCQQIIQGLLEELLVHSSYITIVDIKGNYYGKWRTIIITANSWKGNESISLEFDILHEI